ncbi:PHD zinc finger-containing protein [Tieghemostelium lacteum]|uniref:PHD zinc finger-containing protein n=1 Tax=Tieghemostelium lacteum TaxID=361077 RepID=A0A152A0T9_TIELA|nr:PHD zinc finger-containing protein [Tieghemostelium lacteum]|eukprot:KYQ99829.1 PHD zinc finger-containing protein [Tieghemostelium lacteum]
MKKSKICSKCEKVENNDEINLLKCVDCSKRSHIYCVDPPLNRKPRGDWTCSNCQSNKSDQINGKRKVGKKNHHNIDEEDDNDEEEEEESDNNDDDDDDEEEEKDNKKEIEKSSSESESEEVSEQDNSDSESNNSSKSSSNSGSSRSSSEDETNVNGKRKRIFKKKTKSSPPKSKNKKKKVITKSKKKSKRKDSDSENDDGDEEKQEEKQSSSSEEEEEENDQSDKSYNSGSESESDSDSSDSLENLLCSACNSGRDEAKILLCDNKMKGCSRGYHIYCLKTPLISIPKGKWICDFCKFGEDITTEEKDKQVLESIDKLLTTSPSSISLDGNIKTTTPPLSGTSTKTSPTNSRPTSPPTNSQKSNSSKDKEFKSLFIPKNTKNSLKPPAPVKFKQLTSSGGGLNQSGSSIKPLGSPSVHSSANNIIISPDIKGKHLPSNGSQLSQSNNQIPKDRQSPPSLKLSNNGNSDLKKSNIGMNKDPIKKLPSPPPGNNSTTIKTKDDDSSHSILDMIPSKTSSTSSITTSPTSNVTFPISWDLSSSSKKESPLPLPHIIRPNNSNNNNNNLNNNQMMDIDNNELKSNNNNPLKRSLSTFENGNINNNNNTYSNYNITKNQFPINNNNRIKMIFDDHFTCNVYYSKFQDSDGFKFIDQFKQQQHQQPQFNFEKLLISELSISIRDEIQKILNHQYTSDQLVFNLQPEFQNDNSFYNLILKLKNNQLVGIIDNNNDNNNSIMYIFPFKNNNNDFSLIGLISNNNKKLKINNNITNNITNNNIIQLSTKNICFLGFENAISTNIIFNFTRNLLELGANVLDIQDLKKKPIVDIFVIVDRQYISKKLYQEFPEINFYKQQSNVMFIEGLGYLDKLIQYHKSTTPPPMIPVNQSILFNLDYSLFIIDNSIIIENELLFTQMLPLLWKLKSQGKHWVIKISDSIFEELKPFSNQSNIKKKLLDLQSSMDKQVIGLCSENIGSSNQQVTSPKTVNDFMLFTLRLSLSPQINNFRNVILVSSNKIIKNLSKKFHSFLCLDLMETINFILINK